MILHAINLKPGMRVRIISPKGGPFWAVVDSVRRQGFLVNVDVHWIAGGKHTWCVPNTQRFRVLSDVVYS